MKTASCTRSGSRHGRPLAIERGVDGRAGRQRGGVRGAHDLVGELHAHRRQQRARRPHLELVVVPRRLAVRAVRLDDRQRRTRRLPSRDSSSRPRAADRCGRPRTRRSSSRSRRRPSGRFRRSARAPRDWTGERVTGVIAGRPPASARAERGGLELARGALGIGRVEDRRAGDEDARAGGDDARDVVQVDAAVDLDRRGDCRRGRAARARPGLWTRCAG